MSLSTLSVRQCFFCYIRWIVSLQIPSTFFRETRILLFILPLILSSCSSTETIVIGDEARSVDTDDQRIEEATEPLVLKIGEANKIRSFDPLFAINTASKRAITLSYEGLVTLDENNDIKPAIAKKWTLSDDSLAYTFTIRNDVFYHDDESFMQGRGRRLEINDIKHVFERMASRDVPADAAKLFANSIIGFEAYFLEQREVFFQDDRQMEHISGIEIANDSTITFHLLDPDPYFLYKLATPYAVVYPSEPFRFRSNGLHQKAVGTGPFRHQSTIGDSIYVFEKNNTYPQTQNHSVSRIELLTTENETRLYSLFTREKLDILLDLGPQSIQTLISDDNELPVELRSFYSLIVERNPDPLTIRFNSQNRYDLDAQDAAASLRNITLDTLVTLTGNPSIRIIHQNTDFETRNIARVFRRFGHGERFRIILGYNQDLMPKTMTRFFTHLIDDNLNSAFLQRRVFSRDMFLYIDTIPVLVPGYEPPLQTNEIMRIECDRYILHHTSIKGIKTNQLSWWIDLTTVH